MQHSTHGLVSEDRMTVYTTDVSVRPCIVTKPGFIIQCIRRVEVIDLLMTHHAPLQPYKNMLSGSNPISMAAVLATEGR